MHFNIDFTGRREPYTHARRNDGAARKKNDSSILDLAHVCVKEYVVRLVARNSSLTRTRRCVTSKKFGGKAGYRFVFF